MKRLLLLLSGLAACSSGASGASAPTEAGVCWRMSEAPAERPTFTAVARGIKNLETCAVRLEALRMMEGRAVSGAYQGHFIWVSDAQITSADQLDGVRFRVFEPAARLEIQQGLQKLIELRAQEGAPETPAR